MAGQVACGGIRQTIKTSDNHRRLKPGLHLSSGYAFASRVDRLPSQTVLMFYGKFDPGVEVPFRDPEDSRSPYRMMSATPLRQSAQSELRSSWRETFFRLI